MENTLTPITQEKAISNVILYNSQIEIRSGIVFLYCAWSPTVERFKVLLNSLKEFPDIPVYVFDIDGKPFEIWSGINNKLSQGYGEIFWLRDGMIVNERGKGELYEKELTTAHEVWRQRR